MGLFDKLKNMFTEEEEIEEKEPIKKEVFQVEIPAPKIEEKKEEVIEPEKTEKFVFPVYFDDNDFKEEPPKKPQPAPYSQPYSQLTRQTREEKNVRPQAPVKNDNSHKRFKLSPVISPVYGILDKNYKKEDIIEKKSEPNDYFGYKGDSALRVDKVRKKAFGTLEDELESTLNHVDLNEYTEVEQVVTPKVKEELESEANSKPTEELEDMFFDSDMTLEEAINKYDSTTKTVEEPKEEDEKDDLIESDLFNLIDSMYDKETKEE